MDSTGVLGTSSLSSNLSRTAKLKNYDEINYRLFNGKDKQSVLELWKICNLIVS